MVRVLRLGDNKKFSYSAPESVERNVCADERLIKLQRQINTNGLPGAGFYESAEEQ